MLYNLLIDDHFYHPRHVGILPAGDRVLHACVGNEESGYLIEWFWQFNEYDKKGLVEQQHELVTKTLETVRFRAYGDVVTIAACSWLAEWLLGKSLSAIAALTVPQVITWLAIPPLKQHSVIAVLQSIQNMVNLSKA